MQRFSKISELPPELFAVIKDLAPFESDSLLYEFGGEFLLFEKGEEWRPPHGDPEFIDDLGSMDYYYYVTNNSGGPSFFVKK